MPDKKDAVLATTQESESVLSTHTLLTDIKRNIGNVIVGKGEVTDLLLICLCCDGHVLIEDIPGLGKTSMVSALASSVDCSFQRIQFTPDVLPSDVTGFTMYHPVTGKESFYPGAVMCNILLADELNRTSPKTQSALLQAMQEGVVTVDGVTHELPRPFMVCATQNPVEQVGTYPLPEAQLDRFLMKISMGYPERSDEIRILERNRKGEKKAALSSVASLEDILALQEALNNVVCTGVVLSYIADIVSRTRSSGDIDLGISPRGAIALMRASMGRALLLGRSYVLPDDVQAMARCTLSHRLILSNQAYTQNLTAEKVIDTIMHQVRVPVVSGS